MNADEPIYGIPPDLIRGPESDVLPLSGDTNWGMAKLAVDQLRQYSNGEGVIAAGVDTGIDRSHPLLANCVAAKDFTGSPVGAGDRQGHGCVAPWDKLYTSLCGLQTAEYLFEHAPGIAHFMDAHGTIIKDVSRYGVYTIAADPKTGVPTRSKVLAVHKLRHAGRVYRVQTGQGELTLTPWHPVYVVTSRRGANLSIVKRRADQLRIGDSLLLAAAGPDIGQVVELPYRHRWVCVHCGHAARAGKSERCNQCTRYHWNEGPTSSKIALDEDLAYWLGLVASDGHLSRPGPRRSRLVEFTNKNEEIGELFSRLCLKLFAVQARRYQYGDKAATWKLNCHDAHRLAVACGIPVGDKSSTILLPNLITKSPRAVVMAFLGGLIEGDGCVRADIRLSTGSQEFASEITTLLQTLGIRASRVTVRPSRSTRPSYIINIGGDPELLRQIRVKPTKAVSPAKGRTTATIKSIAVSDYIGPMFDLTVEGTHNYVANGHIVSNTHISGTVAATDPRIGVATGCKFVHGKALSDQGSGSGTWIAAAIRWAAEQGAEVISMSLGSSSPDQRIIDAMKEVASKGIWIVAAAGNSGPNTPDVDWPGRSEHCLSVAALDANLNPASFSSAGAKIDTSGPGVNIWSTKPGGGYQQMSGTSMATPFIAGVLTLYRSLLKKRNLPIPTVYELRNLLFNRSTDAYTPGDDRRTGPGFLNPLLLAINLTADPPPVG